MVRSFKMNHVTDLTFRYIGQVDNTDSACFYTFLNDGKLYYDEAFLSDDPSISPAHQWTVVYGGHNPVRMNWRQPITRIAESGQTPSGKSYVLEGGFINNPSINDIEYTFADGAIQDIPVTHGQKLYTLFKVSANTKDVGVLRIQAYHRTPIKLE
ncbi:hypothetical protein [Alicyclobacillus suci]|uniref:hypothetical protein n=1 Tax=Alicyclobacillus suci TaxID=2816080 RepID=UPI001A8D1A3B|nr:hypothetical protein [Alicyclobacillus suci]